MMFEIAGFVCGITAIWVGLVVLYRRQSNRVVEAVYAAGPRSLRG